MPRSVVVKDAKYYVKAFLWVLLFLFSFVAIGFSLYVLFSDMEPRKSVSPEQAKGMFTVFAYRYINEVNPEKPTSGKEWTITNLDITNTNFALVEATDGVKNSKLEFIYVVEPPNVRVLKINDVTGRELQDADLTAIRFLDLLHSKRYADAATYFGGPVSMLLPYGKGASELPKMLEGYCETVASNGECPIFKVSSPTYDEATKSYHLSVQYLLSDGSIYTTREGKNTFSMIVESHGGKLVVITLPFD